MTENEAINELQANIDLPFGFTVSDEVSEVAIQALEEIQQYRAIGTVERFRFLQEVCDLNGDELENIANSMIELKNYRAIGKVEELKALKEKSVAKKPNKIERKRDEYGFIYQIGECPCCGKLVTDDRECCDCMQKFDWSE